MDGQIPKPSYMYISRNQVQTTKRKAIRENEMGLEGQIAVENG